MANKYLMTREEFATPAGKKLAWRSLYLGDHHFLRVVYDNSHEIAPGVWRTFQPSPKQIKVWADKGIKTIINLRGKRNSIEQSGFHFLEEQAAKAHNITLINFRAYSREAPSKKFILELKDLFERINYPMMMHCKSGADRAGVAATLFMFLHLGEPLDEALIQLSYKYGHVKHGKTGVIDHFFEVYKDYAKAMSAEPTQDHFLNWVETTYDEAAVKASFKPTWLGGLITETILRRE